MKKNLQNLFLVLLVGAFLSLASCSEDEPLPLSTPGFEVVTVAPEINLPVQFENNSLNADSYVWDYGDGSSLDSGQTIINGVHTYEDPGTYTVKLRAYNQDGQMSEATETISVGRRYLTQAIIINIDMLNQDSIEWDEDSGPDVFMILGPTEGIEESEIVQVFIENLNTSELTTPLGISDQDFIPEDYELNDELFFLDLYDVDTVDTEAQFQPMISIEFNPVTNESEQVAITSVKEEDGTGFIQIPFVVIGKFQFLWFFEVR